MIGPSPAAFAAVAAIERDLCDRKGIGDEWESLDDAIKDEIRDAWARIMETVFNARDRDYR